MESLDSDSSINEVLGPKEHFLPDQDAFWTKRMKEEGGIAMEEVENYLVSNGYPPPPELRPPFASIIVISENRNGGGSCFRPNSPYLGPHQITLTFKSNIVELTEDPTPEFLCVFRYLMTHETGHVWQRLSDVERYLQLYINGRPTLPHVLVEGVNEWLTEQIIGAENIRPNSPYLTILDMMKEAEGYVNNRLKQQGKGSGVSPFLDLLYGDEDKRFVADHILEEVYGKDQWQDILALSALIRYPTDKILNEDLGAKDMVTKLKKLLTRH